MVPPIYLDPSLHLSDEDKGGAGSWGTERVKIPCQTASPGSRPEGTWEPGQLSYKGLIVAAHWIGNDL